MVEAKGEMNAKQETMMVTFHFLVRDQFIALNGSFGPFQSTFEGCQLNVYDLPRIRTTISASGPIDVLPSVPAVCWAFSSSQ
jgi:hypothetical protein